MDNEQDSGFCAHCGRAGATVSVGEDDHGNGIFVHEEHVGPYLRRALGRDLADLARMTGDE